MVEFSLRFATHHNVWRTRRLLVAAAGVAACFFASPVSAQVMEIAPDGTVSLRQGAGAANFEIVSPVTGKASSDDGISMNIPQMAMTPIDTSVAPPQFVAAVNSAAASANISPSLLAALVWQESRWNPQAVSPKGALGLAQLMPGTARWLGVNPADPQANLTGGARYLRMLLDQFDGDVEKALAAYNAGPGRVSRAGGVPAIAETQNYVASIVRRISYSYPGGNQ